MSFDIQHYSAKSLQATWSRFANPVGRSRRRHGARRAMHVETLENRQLLAADVIAAGDVAPFGEVHGFKFNDANANGQQDADEVGVAGVTIYSDLNNNGQLDRGEPSTITMQDDPDTADDETGFYWLGELSPGNHLIREVVPEGARQTYPGLIGVPEPQDNTDEMFSQVRPEIIRAIGLPGDTIEEQVAITIFPNILRPIMLDVVSSNPDIVVRNHSGPQLNSGGGDTTEFEIAFTADGRSHRFELQFVDIETGDIVDQIPVALSGLGTSGAHEVSLEPGGVVRGIDFGNYYPVVEQSGVAGRKWNDLNGNGIREANEPGLPGVTIYADLNHNGRRDRNEPSAVTMPDNPNTRFDETGLYSIVGLQPGTYEIREVVPDGYQQTYPGFLSPPGGPEVGAADEYSVVNPEAIRLPADAGIPLQEEVSITIFPNLFRPVNLDVVPSDPNVQIVNESGPQLNGGGGDTSTFTITFFATGVPQEFELQFVHVDTQEIVNSIPVSMVGGGEVGGSHVVRVEAGEIAGGLDFGNQRVTTISGVSGRKWSDTDGDGERDRNEPGLGGVTIYADLNHNSRFDRNEPSTVTSHDDPATDFDEAGLYRLGLVPGDYEIREVVPEGYQQTFPGFLFPPILPGVGAADEFSEVNPDAIVIPAISGIPLQQEVSITIFPNILRPILLDVVVSDPNVQIVNESGTQLNGGGGDTSRFTITFFPTHIPRQFELQFIDAETGDVVNAIPVSTVGGGGFGGAHSVSVGAGEIVEGLDFGNQPIATNSGISGRKWSDTDGDGERDENEQGLGGVTIYADVNRNGQLDPNEPSTVTSHDIPETDFDEAGLYSLGLRPGDYLIREVVPRGYEQTYPNASARILNAQTGRFHDGVALDFNLTDIALVPAPAGTTGVAGVLEMTVVWPDSCGDIIEDATSATLVGDSVLVQMYGHQVGDACAEVISPQTQRIRVDVPELREFQVVGTLHEQLRDATRFIPTLAFVATVGVSAAGAHAIALAPGQNVDGLDFGNHPIVTPTAVIEGRKWADFNRNGTQEPDEPGVEGVVIYADLNNNGELDRGEPLTRTGSAAASPLEQGRYRLEVPAGRVVIREIVPEGAIQTFPGRNAEVPFAHVVFAEPGQSVSGIRFGNTRVPVEPGAIRGQKWADENGNGLLDRGEPGLPGVVIYLDINHDGMHQADEPSTVTQEDIPETDFDESGLYLFRGLEPGRYVVREVVPDGYVQTYPGRFVVDPFPAVDLAIPLDAHYVLVESGQTVDGIDFGNQKIDSTPGSIHGMKWLDQNGDGIRDPNEPGLPGVTIYLDLNHDGRHQDNEPFTRTMRDDPNTRIDEAGMYWLEDVAPGFYEVREVVPDGYVQTFPTWITDPLALLPPIGRPGSHFVGVRPGSTIEGIDFGNRRVDLEPGSIHGLKWLDQNGNGQRDREEPGLPGVVIYVDLNNDGRHQDGEPAMRTMVDDPSTNVDETGMYWLQGLQPGGYFVREIVPEGFHQTYPTWDIAISPAIEPGSNAGHYVVLRAGETVRGIDFGNARDERQGAIHGRKWRDDNGDGVPSAGEPWLAGVTIYLDTNFNGEYDRGEPQTVTAADNPATSVNELGRYKFENLAGGTYLVKEIVPDGYVQTFPPELPFGSPLPIGQGHLVHMLPGQTVEGLFFGNQPRGENGAITGVKWNDRNGNGRREDGEEGLGGVTIYLDLDNDGSFDRGEPSTVTEGADNTPTNEVGRYVFADVEPGVYMVREIVPQGYEQTFPIAGNDLLFSESHIADGSAAYEYRLAEVSDVISAAGIPAIALTFEVVWRDSCGNLLQDQTRYESDGGEIHVRMHGIEEGNICLQVLTPETQTITIENPAVGRNHVHATLEEIQADGSVLVSNLEAEFIFGGSGAHIVEVRPGSRVTGIHFGNHSTVTSPTLAVWNGRARIGQPGDGVTWDDPNNWTSGREIDQSPSQEAPGMDLLFGLGASPETIVLGGERRGNTVRFNDDYTLDEGELIVSQGEISVSAGAVATLGSNLATYSGLNSGLHKTGRGTLDLHGKVTAISVLAGQLGGIGNAGYLGMRDGVLAPGDSNGGRVIGEMSADTVEFNDAATYSVDVRLDDNGVIADLLNVERLAHLNGNLRVNWIGNATPVGTGAVLTVPIVQAADIEGRFASMTQQQRHLGDGLFFDVLYRDTEVVLRLYRALPGDANGNGIVAPDDYASWFENNFRTGPAFPQGDFNNDGAVDVRDMNLWLANRFAIVPAMLEDTGTDRAAPRAALGQRATPVPAVAQRDSRVLVDAVMATARPLNQSLRASAPLEATAVDVVRGRDANMVRRHGSVTQFNEDRSVAIRRHLATTAADRTTDRDTDALTVDSLFAAW